VISVSSGLGDPGPAGWEQNPAESGWRERDGEDAMTRPTGAGSPDDPPGDPPEAGSKGLAARDGYGRGVSPFRAAGRRPVLHRLVPVSELAGYGAPKLRNDLLAGVGDLLRQLLRRDPDRPLLRRPPGRARRGRRRWHREPDAWRGLARTSRAEALAQLDDAGVVALVGPDHLYPTVRAAVQAAPGNQEEPQ
jgi:hypothetical protein